MIKGFFNLPWFAWAGLAFIVAMIYYFVWTHIVVTVTTGFRFLVIRYAHELRKGFSPHRPRALMEHTDTVAEIQNTLRAGIDVKMSGVEIVGA